KAALAEAPARAAAASLLKAGLALLGSLIDVLALEHPHHLDMGRPEELIHRLDLSEAEAAIRQDAGVPGEGRGIAGDPDADARSRGGDLSGLVGRPGARGIEAHGLDPLQLPGRIGAA